MSHKFVSSVWIGSIGYNRSQWHFDKPHLCHCVKYWLFTGARFIVLRFFLAKNWTYKRAFIIDPFTGRGLTIDGVSPWSQPSQPWWQGVRHPDGPWWSKAPWCRWTPWWNSTSRWSCTPWWGQIWPQQWPQSAPYRMIMRACLKRTIY